MTLVVMVMVVMVMVVMVMVVMVMGVMVMVVMVLDMTADPGSRWWKESPLVEKSTSQMVITLAISILGRCILGLK